MNPIIMPVRAGLQMTRAAATSALAQDIVGGTTLVLIDNDSGECAPYLRSLNAIMLAYRPEKSLNYVWNRALSLVFDQLGCEHALVINNDVVLREDTYRLLLADGGEFVTGIGVDSMEQLASVDVTSKRPHPTFSCFLLRRSVWERIGQFDERYWAYCSDCDFHVRMHRAGIVAEQLALPFYHESSGTLKHVDDATRELICRRADADRELFHRAYGCVPGDGEYAKLFDMATFGVTR